MILTILSNMHDNLYIFCFNICSIRLAKDAIVEAIRKDPGGDPKEAGKKTSCSQPPKGSDSDGPVSSSSGGNSLALTKL